MWGEQFSGAVELKRLLDGLKARVVRTTDAVGEIDYQAIEIRLKDLTEDYTIVSKTIVSKEFLSAMSEIDKVRLKRIMLYLGQEIEVLEQCSSSNSQPDISRFLILGKREPEVDVQSLDQEALERRMIDLINEYEASFALLLTSFSELERTRNTRRLRKIEQDINVSGEVLDIIQRREKVVSSNITIHTMMQKFWNIKRDWIERLLSELAKEYGAGSEQLAWLLDPVNVIFIKHRLSYLMDEIKSIETELRTLQL